MNDIKAKALALVREVQAERDLSDKRAVLREVSPHTEALCRAIEQHEAYQQKVSDAVGYVIKFLGVRHWAETHLKEFIIPAPKPDPLVAVMKEAGWSDRDIYNAETSLRAALDALGFEIREKGQ